jgi:hypothetical protein
MLALKQLPDIFTPALVDRMDKLTLNAIAAETPEARRRRERNSSRFEKLQKAKQVYEKYQQQQATRIPLGSTSITKPRVQEPSTVQPTTQELNEQAKRPKTPERRASPKAETTPSPHLIPELSKDNGSVSPMPLRGPRTPSDIGYRTGSPKQSRVGLLPAIAVNFGSGPAAATDEEL